MREDALQAMREREENLQEEYNRRYGAQVMICYSATIRPAKICRALRLLLIMMGEVLVLRLAMHRFGLVIQFTASEPGDLQQQQGYLTGGWNWELMLGR